MNLCLNSETLRLQNAQRQVFFPARCRGRLKPAAAEARRSHQGQQHGYARSPDSRGRIEVVAETGAPTALSARFADDVGSHMQMALRAPFWYRARGESRGPFENGHPATFG